MIHESDRGHVHRGSAVHDVADSRLARVGVAVVELRDDPLLGEEDALEDQRLLLELRDPARLPDHDRHEVAGHVVRVEVRAPCGVDLDQRVRHQGVIRDVAVSLVVRGDGARGAPVRQERADDAGHPPAVALLDLLRRPSLGRSAQGVAHGGSGQNAGHPILDHTHR